MQIKIMTFNIQHGRDFIKRDINLPMMADVIRNQQADIIGLNEVRGKGTHVDYQEQAQIIGEDLGFYYYFVRRLTCLKDHMEMPLFLVFPLQKWKQYSFQILKFKDEKVLCYENALYHKSENC